MLRVKDCANSVARSCSGGMTAASAVLRGTDSATEQVLQTGGAEEAPQLIPCAPVHKGGDVCAVHCGGVRQTLRRARVDRRGNLAGARTAVSVRVQRASHNFTVVKKGSQRERRTALLGVGWALTVHQRHGNAFCRAGGTGTPQAGHRGVDAALPTVG